MAAKRPFLRRTARPRSFVDIRRLQQRSSPQEAALRRGGPEALQVFPSASKCPSPDRRVRMLPSAPPAIPDGLPLPGPAHLRRAWPSGRPSPWPSPP